MLPITCFLQVAQLACRRRSHLMMLECRNSYDVDAFLLYGVCNQPCMRFILVVGLQLVELPDSIPESDRQR